MENIPRRQLLTVGTTPVNISLAPGNGQRRLLVLTNLSTDAQEIDISWGGSPTSGSEAIHLWATGSWLEVIDPAFIPSNLDIWAVSSAADGKLAVHERVE
jgi:hypothetical protein